MSDRTGSDEANEPPESGGVKRLDRRSFFAGTATGFVSGGAIAMGAIGFRDDASNDTDRERKHSKERTDQQQDPGTAEKSAARHIVSSIQERYPNADLDEDSLIIQQHVEAQLQRSRVLSKFDLSGDDRPANLFIPRSDARPASEGS